MADNNLPKLVRTVEAARACSVPLLAIGTADQWATIAMLTRRLPSASGAPVVRWDIARGLVAVNNEGEKVVRALAGDDPDSFAANSSNPQAALEMASKLKKKSILFMVNAHRFLVDAAVMQAVSNLRDQFKTDERTLIMLAPGWVLPPEVANDVVVLDENLPDDAALSDVFTDLYQAAGIPKADEKTAELAVNAVRGLSRFAAEQVIAMSLRPKGIDLDEAWERKRAVVNQTKGLSISKGDLSYSDLGGLDAIRERIARKFSGRKPPRAILFIDEIEKALAGATGQFADSSGVSQDALGVILREMEDNGWSGMILVGPPGTAKTACAKATAKEFGVEMITQDLGAMKGSLVGESEQAIRTSMRVVRGVAGERVFVMATCNNLNVLPPELLRRFRSGIWFFDLPSKEERKLIWNLYLKKYDLPEQTIPPDDDWTGAEIRNCAEIASEDGMTLVDASTYIIPVAQSNPDGVELLRSKAENKWLSASRPGRYQKDERHLPGARKFDFSGMSDDLVAVQTVVAPASTLKKMGLQDPNAPPAKDEPKKKGN